MNSIDVWSDLLCPFCYIGKRHLEIALAQTASGPVDVRWRSFQLDPGADRVSTVRNDERLATKYGRPVAWARQMHQEITRRGAAVGVTFDFDKVTGTNSFDAHRLTHLAAVRGLAAEAQEALFRAHFADGRRIGDADVLQAVGVEIGLDPGDVRELLTGEAYADAVRADAAEARALRVTGVPLFLFDRTRAVSGAQPVDVFVTALRPPA